MSVRAKFKVNSITRRKNWQAGKGDLFEVELSPVMGDSEENKRFYEASPSGMIKLSTINEQAAQYFPLGGEVYVDFTDATPAPEGATGASDQVVG